MSVTCIRCRGQVDGAGHTRACPVLQRDLAEWRKLLTTDR